MRALKIAAAVVAVLVVGIVIALASFDVDQYKGTIAAQAKAATGREVSIGDIDLAISLAPSIVLTDVKLANAPWGSRPEMAILPRLEVRTQLLPLLFGDINLTEIAAVNPDILLEIDTQGRGNWRFDVAREGSSTPLHVGDVSVTGLKLGYRDARAARSADLTAGSITAAIAGALQEMNIAALEARDVTATYTAGGAPRALAVQTLSLGSEGRIALAGRIADQDLKVNGVLAPMSALIARDKPIPAKLEVEVYGITARTDLVLETIKGRAFAKGSIDIPEIDLAKFGAGAGRDDGRLFSAEPLPWDLATGADADLSLSIGTITAASGLALTGFSVPIKAAAGRIALAPLAFTVAGGTVGAEIGLDARARAVTVKAHGKGFTAEALSKALGKGDLIANGPIALSIDVRGSGASAREVMAALDGAVIAEMGESRIRNDAVGVPGAGAVLQVLTMLNPFASNDPYTLARCGVANFQIADGIAHTSRGVVLVTDQMSLTSSGTVDLRDERLDLNVRAQGASGLAGGIGQLAQAVKVTGSLSAPSVGLDQAGVARGVAGLGSALANSGGKGLGGIGALFGLGPKTANAAAPAGDLCAAARAWRRG